MSGLEPIQGLWIGKSLSAMEQLSIRSFLANGHAYHLYLYGPVEGVPEGVCVFDANEVIPGSEVFYHTRNGGPGSPSGFSNLFRYKLLRDRGGWWCDLDVVCLKPFEFGRELVLCGQWRRKGWPRRAINTGIIRAPRNSALMDACYRAAAACGKSMEFGTTGPRLLSRQFYLSWFPRELLRLRWAPRCIEAPHVFQPVDWWLAKEQVLADRRWDLSRSHAVHLWNEMWNVHGLDKSAEPDPRSLYGQLKARYPARNLDA